MAEMTKERPAMATLTSMVRFLVIYAGEAVILELNHESYETGVGIKAAQTLAAARPETCPCQCVTLGNDFTVQSLSFIVCKWNNNVFPSTVDMTVLMEPSQRKLSTDEVNVTTSRASGKQERDMKAEVQPWAWAPGPLRLAKRVLGRAAVRTTGSIFSVVSWPPVFPKYKCNGGRGKIMRPNMHHQHPVNLAGLQPDLREVNPRAQEPQLETLTPGLPSPNSPHWGSWAVISS